MIYLYILRLKDKTHYCGITKNISKRLIAHNYGMSKSTKHLRPLVLVYLTNRTNYMQARLLEKKIKLQGVTRYLYKHLKHNP